MRSFRFDAAIKNMLSFIRCERGVAFIEFAFFVIILLVLYLGGIEVSRYVLLVQKLTDAANQESNIITTTNPKNPPTKAEMDAIMQAVSLMVTPYIFLFNSDDVLIVTDIYDPPPIPPSTTPVPPVVQWRYCGAGAPATGGTRSRLGAVGGPANLSSFRGFTMSAGDEIIVAEIFFNFVPIAITGNSFLDQMLSSSGGKYPIYVNSMSVPRFGSLTGMIGPGAPIQSNCP